MISTIFHINYFEVEDMPFRLYTELREQSANIGNWMNGGKLEFMSADEEQTQAEYEYNQLLRKKCGKAR